MNDYFYSFQFALSKGIWHVRGLNTGPAFRFQIDILSRISNEENQ